MTTPDPGYYAGLPRAILGASVLAEPWNVPPRYLGTLPGTPAYLTDAGAPASHPGAFTVMSGALAGALGADPGIGPDALWAPVVAMGVPMEQLHAQAAALSHNPEQFAQWLATTGAAWDRANLEPLEARLLACDLSSTELEAASGVALAHYAANAPAPVAPGVRWPSFEREAMLAALDQFCPTGSAGLGDPIPVHDTIVSVSPETGRSVAYVLGGATLLGLAGVGIYFATRKRR